MDAVGSTINILLREELRDPPGAIRRALFLVAAEP
jgi:hypothetical protein